MSTTYVNSILIDPVTFINNQTIVNANCSNRRWVDNSMYAAFYLCHNLQSVTSLNDNVTDISGAFYECNNLTNIPSIPNSVTNMSGTFYHCTNLVNIPAIPSSLSNAAYTFAGCSNLTTTPNLPDTITNMWGTFGDCINLTSITQIPNVTSLPVTYANTGITDLPIIPDSVTDLSGTFMGCSNLGDLANTTNAFTNNINITHMNATFYNSGITSIPNLPSNVIYLTNTFANCQNLTKISKDIPSTVIDLGGCFSGCTNLTEIPFIPESVINLCNTFSGCSNLETEICIRSSNVQNATNCFLGLNTPRNVYIPFTYENGINTKTYNSFIAAGYDNAGTKDGITLLDYPRIVYDSDKYSVQYQSVSSGSFGTNIVPVYDVNKATIYLKNTVTNTDINMAQGWTKYGI